MPGKRLFSYLIALVVLGACGAVSPWQAPHYQEHPLAGRIWNVAEARFADKAELSASCLPSAVGPSRDFPVGFELRTPATENVVAAVLSKVVQSATLRAHLRATPALASYLRNERLRYHVRPMAT